jgi:Ca2+-transporting ATPase
VSFTGLSTEEARSRLVTDGPNSLPSDSEKSLLKVALSVMREPMLLLLVAAGVISFVLAELVDALLLMATVLIVLGISIFQERRTERALHALNELTAPLALVIRDGKEERISSSQVVRGDLLILLEGDRITADGRLVESTSIEVDESLLTGESIPVIKSEGDLIFTGSLVVRGHGKAEVSSTGSATELGKIGKSIQEIPQSRTLLQRNVDGLVRVIGLLSLVAVVAVFYIYGSTRNNWLEGALAGISAAMALIPEEFPVIITLFMALGAWRMARVRVIARRPAVIEALGSVTVLCVDKTGTLTRNEMEVAEIQIDGDSIVISETKSLESFNRIIETAALAAPIRPFDPMDRAFQRLASRLGEKADVTSLQEFPLTRERLAYTHLWQVGEEVLVAAKGAPEHIAEMCNLSSDQIRNLSERVHKAAERGFRVIAVAQSRFKLTELETFDIDSHRFEYLGMALLHDPVREGVPEAVQECANAGIRTVMITGDHPTTALAIAKEIGIDGHQSCITGKEIEGAADSELKEIVRRANVFARVNPEHKLRLVRALKSNGEVVAMTGDGVNDAPALRAADVGIAMGARGTDVAREAASLVITDDNYTSIVAGIHRGRAIFANIQKAMSYVIAVHVPIFGMALVPLMQESWPLILLPALIAFHEVIIDPACSVVFEVEEPDPEIMKRSPRPSSRAMFGSSEITYAFLQGAFVFAGVFAVFLYSLNSGNSDEITRSLTFGTLLVANVFLILSNRSRTLTLLGTILQRRNRAVPWITGGAFLLLLALLNIPFLSSAFELSSLPLTSYLAIFLIGYLTVCWTDLLKLITRIRTSL